MKLELKIKLAEYETLGIQTTDYYTGVNKQDLLNCIDEIILNLKFHYKYFPKPIDKYLSAYEHMRNEIIKKLIS